MWDENTVRQMADLAKISLSASETRQLSQQMQKVYEYFKAISAHDLNTVTPLITPVEIHPHWRDDVEVKSSEIQNKLLANAPEHQGALLKVPAII